MRRSILLILLGLLAYMVVPQVSVAENLEKRYQVLEARHAALVKENKMITAQIEVEQKKILVLQEASKDTANLPRQLDQYLLKTTKDLQKQIKTGIPFDESLRLARVEQLQTFLAQSTSTADKFRRMMEVLITEAQYGTSIETYPQRVELDGQVVLVNMVRVGKVGLFYTTVDQKASGFYNTQTGQFEKLPSTYIEEIIATGEIAQKRRPAELVRLPVGKVVLP